MILAFNLADIVQVPFGYLMSFLYQLTSSYGLALILFAILVKLILLPATAKGKRSTMKMSRLSPRIQAIQKKYENDQQKQNEAVQALYKEEGVSMGGGCLWSFLPLLIMFPLYAVVRQPITYMLHETAEVAAQIVEIIKGADGTLFSNNAYYDQMIAASQIPNFVDQIKEVLPDLSEATLEGVNFNFLQINMGAVPDFKFWQWETISWPKIGALLIPLLSAGSQVLSMFISQRMNNSVVTDEKGLQDKETAKKSQSSQQMSMMMWMMPLMSLWIGFTVPSALSLYWLAQGVISTIIDVILTQKYRKIYDAEDAARLERALELEALEAEKERQRAERRAANPDGITQNTSKKKLQQQQKEQEAVAKAAAKKEYDAKKGVTDDSQNAEKTALSGIADRPFCKGRAYDPERYQRENTEE